jgi:dTDP-4-amino-4,6-dideoxygalactose transaminase
MWSYKDHGKSWDSVYNKQHPSGFRWVHDDFGTNWRMTEIQAVLGRLQLKRMPDWTKKRQENAAQILEICYAFPFVRKIQFPENIEHAHYKCYIFIDPSKFDGGWTRDRLVEEINQAGVPVLHGSCSEVYNEKAFDGTGYRPLQSLPAARILGETSLMFMVHPTLTDDEISKMKKIVEEVFSQAMLK